MKSPKTSRLARACCCVDKVCYKFGPKLDLLDCHSRGGKFSKNCSDCH
jgi:hypothetical protein